jgi:hypothetical protein
MDAFLGYSRSFLALDAIIVRLRALLIFRVERVQTYHVPQRRYPVMAA